MTANARSSNITDSTPNPGSIRQNLFQQGNEAASKPTTQAESFMKFRYEQSILDDNGLFYDVCHNNRNEDLEISPKHIKRLNDKAANLVQSAYQHQLLAALIGKVLRTKGNRTEQTKNLKEILERIAEEYQTSPDGTSYEGKIRSPLQIMTSSAACISMKGDCITKYTPEQYLQAITVKGKMTTAVKESLGQIYSMNAKGQESETLYEVFQRWKDPFSEKEKRRNALRVSETKLQSVLKQYNHSDGSEPEYVLQPDWEVWSESLSPMWFRSQEMGMKPEKFTEENIGTHLEDSVFGFVMETAGKKIGADVQPLHRFSVDDWTKFFQTNFEGECSYPGSHQIIFRKGSERIIEGLRVPGENVESYRKCFSSTHFLFISF